MNNVLGKTVKDAIDYLVDYFKDGSGEITIYSRESEQSNGIGLYFREGSGCLITSEPIMEEKVVSFTISGLGYYKFIDLYV